MKGVEVVAVVAAAVVGGGERVKGVEVEAAVRG